MIQIVNGRFQDSKGNAVALGSLVFVLSQDAEAASIPGQVAGGIPINVPLDVNGNVAGVVNIWSNAELTPGGTFYTVTLLNANGAQVWAQPQIWVFPFVTPTDLGSMVPTGPGGPSYPSAIVGAIFNSQIVPFSATPTFTPQAPIQLFKMTLTGNVTSSTLVTTGLQSPGIIIMEITQDATGGRTFAWPTNVIGGVVIGAAANQSTSQAFFFDGTNLIPIGPGVLNP